MGSFWHIYFKDSQTDLVKFYVKYVRSPNIYDNYGLILYKKCKKKKRRIPAYPTYFFRHVTPWTHIFFGLRENTELSVKTNNFQLIQGSRCVNQIEEVCIDIEKTINQTIQTTLNSLERDCDLIASTVERRLADDRYWIYLTCSKQTRYFISDLSLWWFKIKRIYSNIGIWDRHAWSNSVDSVHCS